MESEPGIPDRVPADSERWVPSFPARAGPEPRRRRLPYSVNFTCFLLTIVTTVLAGAALTLDDFTFRTAFDVLLTPSLWPLGLPYSFALILILGAHEMGHYV